MHTHLSSQNESQDFYEGLNAEEADVILSLGSLPQGVIIKLAGKWYKNYNEGKDCIKDTWKALHYYNLLKKAEHYLDIGEAVAHDASPPSPGSHYARTTHLYELFGWLTSVRLAALRADRLFTFIPAALKPMMLVASFSYALELLVDTAVVCKNLIYKQKLSDILSKDNRAYRMRNAAVWLAQNSWVLLLQAAGIILTGGLSLGLTIGLALTSFVFDVWNEWKRKKDDTLKIQNTLNKVCTRLGVLETDQQHRSQLEKDANQVEINNLNSIKSQLEQKLKTTTNARNVSIINTTTVLVGMIVLFMPIPPFNILIGGAIALMGSVYGGLGARIRNTIFPKICETGKKAINWLGGIFGKKAKSPPTVAGPDLQMHDEIHEHRSTISGEFASNSSVHAKLAGQPNPVSSSRGGSLPPRGFSVASLSSSPDTCGPSVAGHNLPVTPSVTLPAPSAVGRPGGGVASSLLFSSSAAPIHSAAGRIALPGFPLPLPPHNSAGENNGFSEHRASGKGSGSSLGAFGIVS